jgi:hypothetical protein
LVLAIINVLHYSEVKLGVRAVLYCFIQTLLQQSILLNNRGLKVKKMLFEKGDQYSLRLCEQDFSDESERLQLSLYVPDIKVLVYFLPRFFIRLPFL